MAIEIEPGADRIQPVDRGPESARPWWLKAAFHSGLALAVAG